MANHREQFFEHIRSISTTQGEQRLLELTEAEQKRENLTLRMHQLSCDQTLTSEERLAANHALRAEWEQIERVWRKWFPTIYTDKLLDPSAEREFPWVPHEWD